MRSTKHDLKNLGLASLGAVLEYFDFIVYVFVAAAISDAFFPAGASPWLKQLQVFGIYAIGYLVRPVAGVIIAHFADRIGRKKLFVFTVLLMSVPTFLMGLLPTYAQVGLLAPAGLTLLRILQGCAVGGEVPGAAVFVTEHSPARSLGRSSGIFYATVNCGLLMGAAAAAMAKHVAALDPAWASLAWRLPFLLGGLFGLLAAYLRRHLKETPMFAEIQKDKQLARQMPVAQVLRDYRAQCAFAVAMVFVLAATSGVYFQYMPTYLIGLLHFDAGVVFDANIAGVAAFVVGMPLWGMLRDRLGWSRTLGLGCVVSTLAALWFFGRLPTLAPTDSRLPWMFVVVGLASGSIHALITGLIASLFPTAIRQSGFALPYTIGTAVFTGLTPLVLAWLVKDIGAQAPLYAYLCACVVAAILAITVRRLPHHLGEKDAAVAPRPEGEAPEFVPPPSVGR